MKTTTLFLFCLLFAINYSTAQNPEMFDTIWYLQATSGETETDPTREADHCEIPLTIFFEQNNTFYGRDRCSEFTGNWSYDATTNFFSISNLINVAVDPCENECVYDPVTGPGFPLYIEFLEEHSNLEDDIWIHVFQTNGETRLEMASPIWDWLRFQDEPLLASSDLNKRAFLVYPNPTSNKLLFTSHSQIAIKDITVYSNLGKAIMDNISPSNSLDVSSLSNGLYFIEITSENGREIHPFIKK